MGEFGGREITAKERGKKGQAMGGGGVASLGLACGRGGW